MKDKLRHLVSIMILLFVFFNLSCKKKKAESATTVPVGGLLYTDNFGNPIASYGDPSDDWGFTTNLNPAELNLFNFTDSLDMTGTVQFSNPKILPAYPNPAKSVIGFIGQFGSSSQTSKLKVVITDPFLNIALRDAIIVGGTPQVFFSVSNKQIFQSNGVYRIYYSLSAKDKPNYKMGYGDFQICPGYIPTPNCP